MFFIPCSGTFQLKRGSLQFEPASGKISGEIVVDAASGDSGSGMRDRKMHKEVLESDRYPEIAFRPDRIEGAVANQGKSSVRVHGMFNIHGVDREITVPAEVEMSEDHWTATVHFTVPYAKWGMKNPSTLFLRVNDSVEIDLIAAGNVVKPMWLIQIDSRCSVTILRHNSFSFGAFVAAACGRFLYSSVRPLGQSMTTRSMRSRFSSPKVTGSSDCDK